MSIKQLLSACVLKQAGWTDIRSTARDKKIKTTALTVIHFLLQVEISVVIRLGDVNDNPPKFDKDHYYTDLGEVSECMHACVCT